MDINALRSIAAVVGLITFIGIIVWAWSEKNSERFNQAAQLPFEEESVHRGKK